MNRKIFALILAVSILLTLIPQQMFAKAESESVFTDMTTHWAKEKVQIWVSNGLTNGYEDNSFKPDKEITRAEFCKLIAKVFGYTKISSETFKDVNSGDWYYEAVLKAREAGIVNGYQNLFNPNNPVTRQDAAVILYRAFDLEPSDDEKVKKFNDYEIISDYAKTAAASLVSKAYMKGMGNNNLNPVKNLTRAEAVTLIDNMMGQLINNAGKYSKGKVNGNLVLNTAGASLKDTVIEGSLYLTEGIGEGEVILENVSVAGDTIIKGGGTNSVIFRNSKLNNVSINKKNSNVRVAFEGKTSAANVSVESKAKVNFDSESTIESMEVSEEAKGSILDGKGTVKEVEVKAKDVVINNEKIDAGIKMEVKAGVVETKKQSPTPVPTQSPAPSQGPVSSGGNPPAPASTTPPTPMWTLQWNDEFDSNTINTQNWTVINTGTVYNNELEYYTDRTGESANAYIKDGSLVLEARKEEYEGRQYTSAKLVTQGKKHWTNGRFEIRAKLPETRGIWPAIWMMPEDETLYTGWPACGEIDIMELLGHEPQKTYGTIHFGNPHREDQGNYVLSGGKKFSDDYHVFAVEWEPGEFRWYVDGNLYHTSNNWYTKNSDIADAYTYPAPFDRDFYLILNLAVGGDWPKNPDTTTVFPARMLVDYVRVYSLTGRPYREAGERPVDIQSPARPALQDGNYIYNGSFDQNTQGVEGIEGVDKTSYWTFSHIAANDGTATASNDNGALKIDITDPGANPYSVQFYQKPVNLEKDETYRVTMDAWASENRDMAVKIGSEADRGWANYSGDQNLALTTSKQTFSFQFKMQGDTNTSSRLELNVGKQGANTVWVDNVRVEKLPKDPNDARSPLPSGNLVYNGTFDQGSARMGFWKFTTSGGAAAAGSVGSVPAQREFRAAISSPGTAAGAIKLWQDGLNIENGKTYKVTFRARAAANRTIEVNAGSADDAMSYSTRKNFSLSTTMKTYTFQFNMTDATDKKAQLQFNMGGDAANVYIDDVSVKSIVPAKSIHVEAEEAEGNGIDTVQGSTASYAAFNSNNASISNSINIPEAGNYTITYRVAASKNTGWLSVGESVYKETIPNSDGEEAWQTVTNSVYLESGVQDIEVFGKDVNLDWFEISKDLVKDGNMNQSSGAWEYWSSTGEGASAEKSLEEGKVKVSINSVGANPWSIGFKQGGVSLEKGRLYRISFDMKSTRNRKIRLTLDKTDYSKYLSRDIEITPDMKNYIIEFTMDYDSDPNTALVFSLGNISAGGLEAHDIFIDNVRFMEISEILGDQVITASALTE